MLQMDEQCHSGQPRRRPFTQYIVLLKVGNTFHAMLFCDTVVTVMGVSIRAYREISYTGIVEHVSAKDQAMGLCY